MQWQGKCVNNKAQAEAPNEHYHGAAESRATQLIDANANFCTKPTQQTTMLCQLY